MGYCRNYEIGAHAGLFGSHASGLGNVYIFAFPSPNLKQSNFFSRENNVDKNERKKLPLIPFLAVALVPFVAFALANALFLPFALAMVDFPNSFLVNLIPSNIPGSGYLIFAVFVLILIIVAMAVLVSPALTSLIANLIVPISTNMPRAIFSGIVFFFFHSVLVVILILLRNNALTPTPANYPFPSPAIGPLIILGFLAGVMLSCSVILFGWLGARIRRKKS